MILLTIILLIVFIFMLGKNVQLMKNKEQASGLLQQSQVVAVAKPTMANKREEYFHSAVEAILRTMYQERFAGWRYAKNIGDLKSENESNEIIVFLKDGSSTGITLKRNQVFAKMGVSFTETKALNPEKTEKTPAESWIEKHAADIEAKISKSKDKGYASIIYPVDTGYLTVVDEIIDLLNERTIYTIAKSDDDKLSINFESLFSYDE